MKLEAFVLQKTVSDIDNQWHSLGIFEMAPGRDMDSKTLVPYGTYEQQVEKFRFQGQKEYGRVVKLCQVGLG